jgi:hypothetical protein
MMDMSDETMKASCVHWSTGKSSVIYPGYNPDLRLIQFSSKIGAWSMLATEIKPFLLEIMTGLLTYIRR